MATDLVVPAAAWEAHRAGLNVLPPREDGSKAPLAPSGTWSEYQRRQSTEEELSHWYGSRTGLGLVCGAISGNLELLEFEDLDTYHTFKEVAQATGLGDLVERLEAGYLERTPGGGVHWFYRCPEISGSTKLARRPKTPEETSGTGDKVKTLIETKGEGGYAIVAPSHGRVHPTGNPYVLLRGGFDTIAAITPEEHQALCQLARSFDQMLPGHDRATRQPPASDPGRRPGDDFNHRADWRDILGPHGWSLVYKRGETGYWRRPGKDRGISATTNYQDSGLLYVFSTSTVFEAGRGYSKFSAYALLAHGSDFRAAGKALAAQGYGKTTRPAREEPSGQDGPEIQVGGKHRRQVVSEALDALVRANGDAPYLFRRGRHLARIATEDLPLIELLTQDALSGVLDRAADFLKLDRDGNETPARPPMDMVRDILAVPDAHRQRLPFPPLVAIAHTPVFVAGGELLSQEGYHAPSGIFLSMRGLGRGIRVDMTLEEAKALLLVEMLGDFPFSNPGSRAHALALLLQPFVRPMIEGATPIYVIDAPARGTGKGLLVEVISLTSHGRLPQVTVLPRSEEEMEKRITSLLLAGHPMVVLDNVKARIESESLAAVLTTTQWRGRRLGKSEMVDTPNLATWVATGNNVNMSDEMVRRTVPIRLDAGVERPEERTGFRHADLSRWVRENRPALVSACLSLVRAWIKAGMPEGRVTLGRFEAWAWVLGGILEVVGVEGFLTNREGLYSVADDESREWVALCAAWYSTHGDKAVGAGEVLALARQRNLLGRIWLRHGDLGAAQRMGHALKALRDRVLGAYRLCFAGLDRATGNAVYSVKKLETEPRKNTGNTGNTGGQAGHAGGADSGTVSQYSGENPGKPKNTGQNNGGVPDMKSGVAGVSSVLRAATEDLGERERVEL